MQPHARFTAFPFFRQVEILNFLPGQGARQLPTAAKIERATAAAKDRYPWPAAESVFVEDDVVVVLLPKYQEGVPRTMSSGR
jgi:site-specific recombinase XerD